MCHFLSIKTLRKILLSGGCANQNIYGNLGRCYKDKEDTQGLWSRSKKAGKLRSKGRKKKDKGKDKVSDPVVLDRLGLK